MVSEKLLLDFLTTDLPLTELAARHDLSLESLLAWADSPETQKLFSDLARIGGMLSPCDGRESRRTFFES
jgi:hypothetical protein